jgi:hypothetical protein
MLLVFAMPLLAMNPSQEVEIGARYTMKVNRKEKERVIVINRTTEKLIFKLGYGEVVFLPEAKRPENCHSTDKILGMIQKDQQITVYFYDESKKKNIEAGTISGNLFQISGNFTIMKANRDELEYLVIT